MRLQLDLAALLLALLVSSPALAQEIEAGKGDAGSRVMVYSDDDRTSVVTSIVDAEVGLSSRVVVGAHALIDTISSASVDVRTAATERWEENRVEVGGRARGTVADTSFSLGYTRSQENDWLSNVLSLGASKELFQRNTVVSVIYGLVLNTVGRASDPNFERDLDGHNIEVGASQLLDSGTRAGGAYTLQYWSGYMASPYRYVRAVDGTRGPERHPDTRTRHALSGYLVRSLASSVAGRIGYRFYVDDWGVRSHTGTVRLAVQAAERYTAAVEGRMYVQNQANFYREAYLTSLEHMTNDRELSSFWDAGAAGSIGVRLGPVDASAKLGVIHYRFPSFPALPRRTALLASGGLKVRW